MLKKLLFKPKKRQLELGIDRPREKDRNHGLGGRSFYFFDFDDNVAFLSTPCFLFHKKKSLEIKISSGEYARHSESIGHSGPYQDFRVDFHPTEGTFRLFRDEKMRLIHKLMARKQHFVKDLRKALELPDAQWKGPSWDCFYHATYNRRPMSVITARGHHPKTIQRGMKEFVKSGDLPQMPSLFSIFPVSHPETRRGLGDVDESLPVAELKRRAIRRSVLQAFELFGPSEHHRFGMSDDDPKNVELIRSEMEELKREFPKNSFYVIETSESGYVKTEILPKAGSEPQVAEQIGLLID